MSYLEPFLDKLLSNPIYIVVAAVIAVFLAIGIIKKLIKLLAVLTIGLVIFLGYLHFTGHEIPTDTDSLKNAVGEVIDQTNNRVSF